MATERKERVIVRKDEDFAQKKRIVEHNVSMQRVIVSRLCQLIWFIVFIVDISLMLRFLMKFIGANPGNAFVNFLYSVTNPMTYPFQSIIANPSFGENSIIDMSVLFATVIYTIAGWALVTVIRILLSDTGSSRQVTTYEKQS